MDLFNAWMACAPVDFQDFCYDDPSRRCFGIMRRILFIYGQLAEIDPCLATVTSDLIKGGL